MQACCRAVNPTEEIEMSRSRRASRPPTGRGLLRCCLALAVAAGGGLGFPEGLAAQQQAPTVEFHPPEGRGMAELPFSEAVRVGHLLYLSGQVGVDPETGELAPGGIRAETRQTMENIGRTLRRHGSSMERVVKCTVFLADMGEWSAMNEVYVTFFPEHRPARSAMGASGIALGARVEIDCIGVVGEKAAGDGAG